MPQCSHELKSIAPNMIYLHKILSWTRFEIRPEIWQEEWARTHPIMIEMQTGIGTETVWGSCFISISISESSAYNDKLPLSVVASSLYIHIEKYVKNFNFLSRTFFAYCFVCTLLTHLLLLLFTDQASSRNVGTNATQETFGIDPFERFSQNIAWKKRDEATL